MSVLGPLISFAVLTNFDHFQRHIKFYVRLWLYIACVWYVFDTCWKLEVLVVSSNENAELHLRHVYFLHAVNISAFRKRLLAKFCELGQKLRASFNFHSHFASMRVTVLVCFCLQFHFTLFLVFRQSGSH